MNRYLLTALLIYIGLFKIVAQDDNTSLINKLKLSGYYENALQMENKKKETLLLDYNKLRLNMDAKIDENFTFSSNINFITYHGATSIYLSNYLPDQIIADYLNATGLTPEAADQLFMLNFENQIFLDNVYISYYSDHFNLRIGKQQLAWGSGYTWNPTNIFHKKNPLDPTYEMEGVNAIKAELPFGQMGMVTGVYSVGDNFKNSTYALKAKNYFAGFDVSASYVYYEYMIENYYDFSQTGEDRQMVGLDLSGSVFGAGLWSEIIYNFKVGNSGEDNYGRVVAGMDYTLNNGLYFMAEYYYNGRGKTDYHDYNMNDWMWSFGQYAENLGRNYINLGQAFPVIGNNLTWSNYLMMNLSDKSGMFYPWLNLSIGDNSELSATAYFPFGEKESEFGGFGFGGLARIRVYF